jgi:hypothetical protein
MVECRYFEKPTQNSQSFLVVNPKSMSVCAETCSSCWAVGHHTPLSAAALEAEEAEAEAEVGGRARRTGDRVEPSERVEGTGERGGGRE